MKDVIGKRFADVEFDGNYKLGTEKGTSFFYCGKPLDKDGIAMCERELKQRCIDLIAERKQLLQKTIGSFQTADKYISIHYRRGEDFTYELYEIYVKNYFDKCRNQRDATERAIKRLEDRIPLSEREIVSIHPSVDGSAAKYIVIVEGTESGKYWDEGEYNRFHL